MENDVRRRSLASRWLRLAPSSPCPKCGRVTKTVQGVCADCWAPKDGRLRFAFRRRDVRPTFWDVFFDDDYSLIPGFGILWGAIMIVLLIGAFLVTVSALLD